MERPVKSATAAKL